MQKNNQKLPEDKKKVKWINPLKDRTRIIPFVVPTQQEVTNALGSLVGQKWRIKKSLQAILPFFSIIEKPEPEDHLYLYEQDGQGYGLYTSIPKNYINVQKQVIYIATFYCNITKQKIKWIKKNVKRFFWGVQIKLFEIKNVPLENFGLKISENGEKYYNAAQLNQHFRKQLPKNAYSVAIITNLLIYNGDNPIDDLKQQYVFGLGCVKDRTSIMSFEEMVKRGYGNKRQQGSEDESEENMEFLLKVVNHELCHTFGLRHCIYYTCLMNGSNGYTEAIKKFRHLCPICLRKLQHNINFDISQRYSQLAQLGDQLSQRLHEAIQESLTQLKK